MRCIRPRMWAVVNGNSCIAPYSVTRSSSLSSPQVRLVPATGRADTASSRPVSARATEATTIRVPP